MILNSPALAAISFEPSGGGVAVVARLLREAFQERFDGQARVVTLVRGSHTTPGFGEKVRYALTLGALQATQKVDFVLYSHVGLAKPLIGMPGTIRQPYAVFLHGIEAWCPLPASQQQLLADARVRIANSSFTARRVMAAHPGIGPVQACPLALPREDAVRQHHVSASSRFTLGPHAVLVVGRMAAAERYKGHDELIDAWPAVLAAVPDAQLVLVGQGDDVDRLRGKAAQRGAGAAVQFTGFVSAEELHSLYERAAIFALPSRGEGFGLVYLEAMSHRLACIGSVHDAARDVIADNQTGLLIDQDAPGALATAIVSLLLDEQTRRRMGCAGADRVAQEFTPERFASRLFDLLGVQPGAAAASLHAEAL